MGQSTDGILLYGIRVEDETLERFDDAYERPDPKPGDKDFAAWLLYMGKSHFGVEVVDHCSDECPLYFLAIAGTVTTAWRGHPMPIDPSKMQSEPYWADMLKEFATVNHVKTEGEPGWWLASMWS